MKLTLKRLREEEEYRRRRSSLEAYREGKKYGWRTGFYTGIAVASFGAMAGILLDRILRNIGG